MHVGCQWGDPTDEMLAFKKRHGVNNLDGGTPTFTPGGGKPLSRTQFLRRIGRRGA